MTDQIKILGSLCEHKTGTFNVVEETKYFEAISLSEPIMTNQTALSNQKTKAN